MLYDFELAGRRVRLWQRRGESYGHVLMKALGFAMFAREFPGLEVELPVGLRYKPDLVAVNDSAAGARFLFWGECGTVSMRKVAWLLKHGDTGRLALFKIDCGVTAYTRELRDSVEPRYRGPGRLTLVNFRGDVAERVGGGRVEEVPGDWYEKIEV